MVPLHSHKLTATLQHTLAGSPDIRVFIIHPAHPELPECTSVSVVRTVLMALISAVMCLLLRRAEAADSYGFAAAAMNAVWLGPDVDAVPEETVTNAHI